MRLILASVLYTALALGANATDLAAVAELRDGTMRKLQFHETPRPVPAAVLLDAEDGEHDLSAYAGKYVVLNFWATWCAPCRQEMPSLDRLEAELGGDGFAVVTVATGRNPVPAIKRFFDEVAVTHLPILRDPTQGFARSMGVLGLPATMVLNPEGEEIARLIGDAEWDSESARAIFAALSAGS
ncbi:MAG: TlpA family protein disulfide reductase [Rhodobacteraceae bacterium]|nr:TlpA family protein disulfide reductase [Paracoccaceae bacterium]